MFKQKFQATFGLILLALIYVCVVLCLPVYASDSRVIFVNKKSESAGLYISKDVIYESDGNEVPEDDRFSFLLKLNSEIVREQSYRLFGKNGGEIFNFNGTLTTEYQENQLPIPFKTDYNGRFSLKNGQTACFEYLKPGIPYEVTESPMADYVQLEPPGGSTKGTILPEGSVVAFKNQYCYNIPEQGEETVLEIRKNVIFPFGYQPPESPEFSFHVFINGKPWSGEVYSLLRTETGEMEAEGVTDETGGFSMKGGYFARFKGIPCNTDYKVIEEPLEGWQALSNPHAEGAAKPALTTVSFTNTESSFAVSKELDSSLITENPFLFQLKREEAFLANAEYYLYTTQGKPVDDEIHQTDENGQFSLFPGQTAVFIRIPMKTFYSVKELPTNDFIQIFPPDLNGYEDKIVSEAMELLPFRNRIDEQAVKPVILRLLKVNENNMPMEGAVFRIYRDASFTEEICEGVSGADGKVDFGAVEPGTYYIQELVSPAGHSLLSNPVKLELVEDGILLNDTFLSLEQEHPDVVFENTDEGTAVTITVHNYKSFQLPLTGGAGTATFLFLAAFGLIVLIVKAIRQTDCEFPID